MMRIHAPIAFALAAALLSACNEGPTNAIEHQIPDLSRSATVLDGSTGGNPHFYFLPPLVGTPTTTGVFNPRLAPSVEICLNTTMTAQGRCQNLLARFTTTSGVNNNGTLVEISTSGQKYVVNWNTKLYTLPLDQPFRTIVFLGNLQLGYLDMVARKGGKFENATTGTAIDVTNTRTLPIAFRIENGVVCGSNTDCFEGSVGPAGGTFTIILADGTRPAGTQFPAGALTDSVNLFIEHITTGECLPTDLQQFQGCYHYSTEPYVPNFLLPVTVGICLLDPAGVSYFNDHQLRLWKWSEVTGSPLLELERVTVDYLNCPTLATASVSSPLLRSVAHVGSMLFGPLANLLGPKDAYAFDGYEGGKLSNFSRIGWVRPLELQITAGDGQTGIKGSALPIQPQVRLGSKYGSKQAVPGWNVNFTPSPDGSVNPASVISGAAGDAATTWTLSTAAGANTLLAKVQTSRPIAPVPYEVQVTFNATAVELPQLTWMPPLVSSGTSGAFVSGLSPVVVISEVGGATLQTTTALENLGKYQTSWDVPTLDPNKIYRIAAWVYGRELSHVDLQAVGNELRNVSTGDKVLNLDNSRSLPIKFVIWY